MCLSGTDSNLLNYILWQAHRHKIALRLFVVAVISGGISYITQLLFPDFTNSIAMGIAALSGIASIGSAYLAAEAYGNKTDFEARQLQVLKEIEMILRERRA